MKRIDARETSRVGPWRNGAKPEPSEGDHSVNKPSLQAQGKSCDQHEASPETASALLSLASGCLSCHREADLVGMVRTTLRGLLPHRSLVAALGRVDLDHVEILRLVAVDHPEAALSAIGRTSNVHDRSALLRWLRTREPVVLTLPDDAALVSELERREIEDHALGRIAAHGVLDLASREGSYFSFAGVPAAMPAPRLRHLLQLVVPHLHQALMSVHRHAGDGSRCSLTVVERELLRWVAAGRTNGEIAALRGRSLATVRNQLSALYGKLGVSNRAEAVRAAGADVLGPSQSNGTNVPWRIIA